MDLDSASAHKETELSTLGTAHICLGHVTYGRVLLLFALNFWEYE